ncbi:Mcm21 protein [Saccharomycopsis crataegensis]|uniref:Mcm21 protein n=1 Tax=Saccharomycopsis crataegensis TaxID=43959 RepID=A0AAV5QIG2_9ASCO|nr:Mcm21 protein [Saccharomycopsis crataegensis]
MPIMDERIEQLEKQLSEIDNENQELLQELRDHLDPSLHSLMTKLYSDLENSEYTQDETTILNEIISNEDPLFSSNEAPQLSLGSLDKTRDSQGFADQMDPSISKFFKTTNRKRRFDNLEGKLNEETKLQMLKKKTEQELIDSTMVESLTRLFGITAFAVSDPSFISHAQNNASSEGLYNDEHHLLGIRLDTYNETTKQFQAPYYIILKRNDKNDEFFIFKHTIPKYIHLTELESRYLNLDLNKFVSEVYTRLSLVLRKKIMLEKVETSLKGIELIDADLSFSKVTFQLSNGLKLQLSLDFTEVANACVLESANARLSTDKKLLVQSIMKGSYFTLVDKFQSALEVMKPDYSM